MTRVRRDYNTNHTLNGTKIIDSPMNVNVKYEKEARFAFGVMGDDRVEVRKRIPLFK